MAEACKAARNKQMLVLIRIEAQYKLWRSIQNPNPTHDEAEALRKRWDAWIKIEPQKDRKYRFQHAINLVTPTDIHVQEAFAPPSSWYKTPPAEDDTQDKNRNQTSTKRASATNQLKEIAET